MSTPRHILNGLSRLLETISFPFSVKSSDIDLDYKSMYKFLHRRNLTDRIGLVKQKDRGLIWLRLRKEKDG